MLRRIFGFSSAVLTLAYGCAPALYRPSAQDPFWLKDASSGITLERLEQGRDLYVRKCGSCHRLQKPEQHDAQEWPRLVEKMERETPLADDERNLILTYLTTVSAHLRR